MMNKNDIIVAASKKSGITQRQMRECAIPFLESLAEALSNGENVYIEGLGSFTIKERKEYNMVFSINNQEYVIKAKKCVKFKVSPQIIVKD
mgnify:CR=1 FL=1